MSCCWRSSSCLFELLLGKTLGDDSGLTAVRLGGGEKVLITQLIPEKHWVYATRKKTTLQSQHHYGSCATISADQSSWSEIKQHKFFNPLLKREEFLPCMLWRPQHGAFRHYMKFTVWFSHFVVATCNHGKRIVNSLSLTSMHTHLLGVWILPFNLPCPHSGLRVV